MYTLIGFIHNRPEISTLDGSIIIVGTILVVIIAGWMLYQK